ncbi:MAG TPA: urease accessory protein UreD [Burkholderiaceae bacterium]|nr:urease accessory protein UreD [Burkholderiaceae bacterium]
MNPRDVAAATWQARLRLDVRRDGDGRCVVHAAHEGPLRVLKTLYPEGDAVAHQVIVHPPGGIVGGDRLEIALRLQPRAHALVTTPGATRFYRSAGGSGTQRVDAALEEGARLEWLALEAIAHSGCLGENHACFRLAADAEMIGWDLVALGLPASGEPFAAGRFTQHLELPGVWLERGVIDSADTTLLRSPLGLAGRSTLLTLWFAAGQVLADARVDALVDAARECVDAHGHDDERLIAGVTALQQRVVVLRALAHRVEPAMVLAQAVRAAWRRVAWQLDAPPPRVWRT